MGFKCFGKRSLNTIFLFSGLKAILEDNSELKAQVVLFGTPAEEGGGGKIEMIEKKCFDDLDFCLMVHPGPVDDVDFTALSIAQLSIVYHGMLLFLFLFFEIF